MACRALVAAAMTAPIAICRRRWTTAFGKGAGAPPARSQWVHVRAGTSGIEHMYAQGDSLEIHDAILKLATVCKLARSATLAVAEPGTSADKLPNDARVYSSSSIRTGTPRPGKTPRFGSAFAATATRSHG